MARLARRDARHRVPAPRRPAVQRLLAAKRADDTAPITTSRPSKPPCEAHFVRAISAESAHADAVRGRREVRFVHLAGLWALAAVQPLFDLLGDERRLLRRPRQHRRRHPDLRVRLDARSRRCSPTGSCASSAGRAQLVFVGALQSPCSPCRCSKDLPVPLAAIAIAAAVGAAAALAYATRGSRRTFVTILGVAPVVVLVLLLVFSPVGDLVAPGGRPRRPQAARSRTPRPSSCSSSTSSRSTSLMTADEEIDAERYPNFARLAEHLHLVPQRDERRPTAPTWRCPRCSPASARRPSCRRRTVYPKQPLHAARPRLRAATSTSRSPASARADSAAPEARPAQGERLRDLATDLSIVERRLLLPDDARRRPPGRRPGLRGLPG